MSYQLKERPHKFSFSQNPIRYLVEVSNPDTPGCAVQFELYKLSIADGAALPGDLITSQTLYPNPDGKCWFYCEDFLNSSLDWQLPELNVDPLDPVNILAVTTQIKKYYIRYRQISKNNPAPQWATDAANLRIVLKGGVSKEKFDRNNYFINWLPAQKNFLTWQPHNHFIGAEEVRYLTYFHHYDSAPALILKARKVFTDGSEEIVTKDFPALSESLLFHCPAGMVQLNFAVTVKKLWYYDVSVVDAGGTVYANPYRLYADYRQFYNVFSFIYHNSPGGIDTLRVRGDYEVNVVRKYTEIQQATDGDFSGQVLPTENAAINITKYKVYKGDAGFMNTPEQQEACEELLDSESVYRIFNKKWLRVINMQKNQPMGESDATKWSFPLEWRYTFDNLKFTPDEVDLGAGEDDEADGIVYGVCTPPEDLAFELLGPDGDGKAYRFTWSDVADAALGYELQYMKDGDTDWTTYPDPLLTNTVDITFLTAGNYSWRVRSKCDEDDFSNYGIGPGFTVEIDVAACSAPASLTVNLVAITDAVAQIKFTWPAVVGVVGYIVEVRPINTAFWQSFTLGLVTELLNIPVFPNTQYECRIRSICNATPDYSGYVYGPSFIASNLVGSCNAPTGLFVTMGGSFLSHRHVKFWWTNAANTDDYDLQYKYWDQPLWTIVNNCQAGEDRNLHNDRTFNWRVRSNCTGGGVSAFANGVDFST